METKSIMAKPKDPITLFLSNVWVIILFAVFGIAFLTVTVLWLVLHKLLLAVILALFFAIIEGLIVRLGLIKVDVYKWMPLVLLFLPFLGFFAGYGLERAGFYVTPLDTSPPIPAYSPIAAATNVTIILMVTFMVVAALALFIKPKQ